MMSMNFFKENKSNVIEISDYPPEEFLVFLIYLYSDHMNLDINSALDLLKGADMYAVNNLKGKLENYLSSSLEIENAAKIFKYSSFYNHEKLKKVALAFIKDNYKNVIDSNEFEELPREFMLEIIRFCKSN